MPTPARGRHSIGLYDRLPVRERYKQARQSGSDQWLRRKASAPLERASLRPQG
jgi:hypothetical protein